MHTVLDDLTQNLHVDVGQFADIKAGLAQLVLAEPAEFVLHLWGPVARHDVDRHGAFARRESGQHGLTFAPAFVFVAVPAIADDAAPPHDRLKSCYLFEPTQQHLSIAPARRVLDGRNKGRRRDICRDSLVPRVCHCLRSVQSARNASGLSSRISPSSHRPASPSWGCPRRLPSPPAPHARSCAPPRYRSAAPSGGRRSRPCT